MGYIAWFGLGIWKFRGVTGGAERGVDLCVKKKGMMYIGLQPSFGGCREGKDVLMNNE